MWFIAKKEILLNGIQISGNIINAKTSLPILSNILIETQQDKIRLTATDLDIGISCVIPVDIKEQGAITVPAKKFNEIIRELSADIVEINTKKNNLINIETQSCHFKIMGLDKEGFPRLPDFKNKEVIKIKQEELKQLLKLTSFVISFNENETAYVLNGVLFSINKDKFTLVATDGKRLAVAEKKINQGTDRDIKIIIPFKTICELNRNLKDEGELSLVLGANQVLFDLDGVVIISRVVDGEFPDYQQVIPVVSNNKFKVNREQFLLAVKRAALLSTQDYQAVRLEIFRNKLVVLKSTPDVGESREE
ncbi:MAG: DNA polymerase III subunit beta, partial [Candidatus Omnitrophota bacterium]|nr:DNA polymerase III subunit beta [Candidatus Omnitrophota bacterium]